MTTISYLLWSQNRCSWESNLGPDWKDYKVSSLSGIEKFENLCFLYCEGIGLTSIDLSHNTKLVYLNCAYNNGLTSLDISGCTQLTSLECQSTALTALSVPRPEKLTRLNYGSTQLSLDLTEYTDLTFLGCGNLGLSSLNIPTALMSQLTELHCDNNNYKTKMSRNCSVVICILTMYETW